VIKPWLYSVVGLTGFLLISYLLILFGLPLLLPFVLALVVAELMEPVVTALTVRARVPRSLSVAIVLLFVVGVSGFAVTAAVGRIIHEVQQMVSRLPYLYPMALDLSERFAQQFSAFHAALPNSIQQLVMKNITALEDLISDGLAPLTTTLGYVGGLPMFLINLFFFLIATFFISRDRREIGGFLLRLFPELWRSQITEVRVKVWSSAMGFAKAQAMLIMMTMMQSVVGLLVIGAPYAVVMGILIGVADILPLLGPGTILVPWAVFSIISGNPLFGLKLIILYAVVAGVRQMLEAKVVGDRMGLHPLAILVSFYLGFHFFGAIGFVVGPLLTMLLKALIQSGLLPIFQDRPKA
jgi:sporulation integral membrane protein YtvI